MKRNSIIKQEVATRKSSAIYTNHCKASLICITQKGCNEQNLNYYGKLYSILRGSESLRLKLESK
jgi:hypothetical protein